jgi:hypothetical protein
MCAYFFPPKWADLSGEELRELIPEREELAAKARAEAAEYRRSGQPPAAAARDDFVKRYETDVDHLRALLAKRERESTEVSTARGRADTAQLALRGWMSAHPSPLTSAADAAEHERLRATAVHELETLVELLASRAKYVEAQTVQRTIDALTPAVRQARPAESKPEPVTTGSGWGNNVSFDDLFDGGDG